MIKSEKYKKIICLLAIMAFIVVLLLFHTNNVYIKDSRGFLFGYKGMVVLSDSMKRDGFSAGDLIVIKKVDPVSLKEGDTISFVSSAKESYGVNITHRIKEKTVCENGMPGFITYGTANGMQDELPVKYSDVLGKYQWKIKGAGEVVAFLKSQSGYFLFVIMPLLLLLICLGRNAFFAIKEITKKKISYDTRKE